MTSWALSCRQFVSKSLSYDFRRCSKWRGWGKKKKSQFELSQDVTAYINMNSKAMSWSAILLHKAFIQLSTQSCPENTAQITDTALVMNSIFLAYKDLWFYSMFTFVVDLQNILKDLYKSLQDDVFHYNYPTKLGLHLVTWCRTYSDALRHQKQTCCITYRQQGHHLGTQYTAVFTGELRLVHA